MKVLAAFIGLTASALGTAWAQSPDPRPHITVAGFGMVETKPTIGIVAFTVTGEGSTAEVASRSFVAKRQAIEAGLGVDPEGIRSNGFSVQPVRAANCDPTASPYEQRAVPSTGNCSITGYVASAEMTVRTSPAEGVGSLVARATQLGAIEAKSTGFEIADPVAAARQAASLALANAKASAEAIAAGSGRRLGPVLTVSDSEPEGLIYANVAAHVPAMRVSEAPVIVVNLRPDPIKTSARLTVTYALEP